MSKITSFNHSNIATMESNKVIFEHAQEFFAGIKLKKNF